MYTYQQRVEYAKQLQRLQQLVVIKDNIHLTYQYKNRNKAYANIDSLQDRINKAIIEDAVNGNAESIKNLGKQGQKLINDTLINERKRLHPDKKHKAINHATKSNSQYYTGIFNYRRAKLGESLHDKIDKEMKKPSVIDLSDTEKIQHLTDKYGDHGKQRLKNIIKDAMHTNESNIAFIKAIEDGYNYKIWKNGRVAKGRTRAWHKEKYIQAVPIDETFDIYGSYPAHMMYPGDLNGGAENVANCRCLLLYTNNIPSNLRKKTVFNVAPTFQQIWEKAKESLPNLKNSIKTPVIHSRPNIDKSKVKKVNSNINASQIPKLKLYKKHLYQLFGNRNVEGIPSRTKSIKGVKVNKEHNTDYISFKLINDQLKSLNSLLTKYVKEIKINVCPYKVDENKLILGFVSHENPRIVEFYNSKFSKEEYIKTIVHEFAHVLDHNYYSKLYGISNSEKWIEAYKLDKQHIINCKNKVNKKSKNKDKKGFFVSEYAKESYYKSISYKFDNPYNSRYAEDFAESVQLYFEDKKKFGKYYPNRAEVLRELFGE